MGDTTEPRALAIVCPGGLRCVLSHTRAQPVSLVTKLCAFGRAGRAVVQPAGQPEPRVAQVGNTR